MVAPQVPDASSSSLTVFVSYQWDLQDSVEIIKNKIEESGLQCWMSSGEMGGDNTLLAKKDAEIQACKVILKDGIQFLEFLLFVLWSLRNYFAIREKQTKTKNSRI